MCLIWGREPGCAPGGAVTFSCLAKRKSPKRRRPYCACPFAALRATCDARAGGAPQNSLRACSAPFKQLRRVSARSACVLRHTHAPPALRFSARTEGNPQPDIHTGHRFARPRLRGRKRLALRYPGRTQRWPVWLLGCWAVGLLGCCRYNAYKIKKKVFHFKMVFLKLKNWFGLWFFIRILSEPLM